MQQGMVYDNFIKPAKIVHLLGLKEGSMFADFGCGSGAYVLAASPLVGNSGTVFALDIQKDLILKLKQDAINAGYGNIRYLWGDFEQLGATNITSDSLDVVLISNTLFQLDDKEGALVEAYRVLKAGGMLVLIDWSESFKGMGPPVGQVITKTNALALVRQAGFMQTEEFAPGEHHYGLRCIK